MIAERSLDLCRDRQPRSLWSLDKGKSALFKQFGGAEARPVALDTQDSDPIVEIVRGRATRTTRADTATAAPPPPSATSATSATTPGRILDRLEHNVLGEIETLTRRIEVWTRSWIAPLASRSFHCAVAIDKSRSL